jgi:hypothetical protein
VFPGFNDGLIQSIRDGNIGFSTLHSLWAEGHWHGFAALVDAFESHLLPPGARLLSAFNGAKAKHQKRLGSKDHASMQFLALGYLAQGNKDHAADFLNAARAEYERQGQQPMPSAYFALGLFIETILAYNSGNVPQAKELAGFAVQHYADMPVVCETFSEICRLRPVIGWSPLLQKPFPVNYSLPRTDPFGTFTRSGGQTSLRSTLDSMTPDQLLFVYLLGPYRTNGPYQEELIGLRSLFAGFPDRIAGVHLITARQNGSEIWETRNQIEEAIIGTGLNYEVCTDADDAVGAALGVESFPSLCILGRDGMVLSTGLLAWEDGFWQALARKDDPAFLSGGA